MKPAPRREPAAARGRGGGAGAIRFHIGRLSLPDMSRADAQRVVGAMRLELTRLAGALPVRGLRNRRVAGRQDGGTLRAGARPEEMGEHLAAQIYRRLSP